SSEGERTMRFHKRFPLVLLATALVRGQSADISGYIFDPSGRPVPDANITCGGLSARTQADGSFHFSGASACQATISAVGFAVQSAPLSGSNNRVELTVAGVSESVVVSATRSEASPDQAAVAANIVTADDLRQRQFPFVLDLLREMPGAQVVRTGRYG